jgi:hypothetical protein
MSDRLEEIEAIKKRVAEIGEKDGDGHWLELTCAKELGVKHERVWIHTTRDEAFVRFEKESGKIGYNRGGHLEGDEDQTRMVRAHIGGVPILRHRAIALAASIMTLEQYLAPTKFYVDHVEPRQPGEMPDDRPENLRIGPPSANNANPKNKKRVSQATGKPVTLTLKSTGVQTPFQSAKDAAKFIGVNKGSLIKYLNREEGSRRDVPEGKGAEWEAEWTKIDGFECADAVRIPSVPEGDDRRISPTMGLLRSLGDGKYALARNVSTMHGYLTTGIGGKNVRVHRLVFKVFKPAEFAAEIAKMPPGTDERKLHIDHIDGDKLNNALSNLRPADPSKHRSKHSAAIRWIDERGEVLGAYTTAAEAAREVRGTDGQPLRGANILAVCKKVCAHTGGQRFEYVDANHAKDLAAASVGKKRKRDAARWRGTSPP